MAKNSEYDQEICHNHKLQTNLWHLEEEPRNNHETPGRQTKQSNQLSLFPIKMIAKLEWTQSNTQQSIEQLQNPTIGVRGGGGKGLNAFYWFQIFALDSAVVEAQRMLSSH